MDPEPCSALRMYRWVLHDSRVGALTCAYSWGPGVAQNNGVTDEHYRGFLNRVEGAINDTGGYESSGGEDDVQRAAGRRPSRPSVAGDSGGMGDETLQLQSSTGSTTKSSRSAGSNPSTDQFPSTISSRTKRNREGTDVGAGEMAEKKKRKRADFQINKTIEEWSTTEFLIAKDGLKLESSLDVATFTGTRGMVKQLGALFVNARQKGCDFSDLKVHTQEVIDAITLQMARAIDLNDRILRVTIETFTGLKRELGENRTVTESLKNKYTEQVNSLNYKMNNSAKDNRQEKSKNTWQITKIATHLQKGGNGEGISKHFGKGIGGYKQLVSLSDDPDGQKYYLFVPEYVQKNPSQGHFDSKRVAIFVATEGTSHAEGLGFVKSLQEDLDAKLEVMISSMNDNPKWKGCQAALDLPIAGETFDVLKHGIDIDSPGSRLMVTVIMNNSRRCGPAAIPFGGSSNVFYGWSAEPVWLAALPMAEFLRRGITVEGLDRFLETVDGAEVSQRYFLRRASYKGHGGLHACGVPHVCCVP